MDVDGEEGALQFTFMATAEGMRACHFEDSSMHLRSVMNYISVQNRKGLRQSRTATKADVITNWKRIRDKASGVRYSIITTYHKRQHRCSFRNINFVGQPYLNNNFCLKYTQPTYFNTQPHTLKSFSFARTSSNRTFFDSSRSLVIAMEGSSLKRSFIDSVALGSSKRLFRSVSCILFANG
jgi:hypothetical protein